jgi:hypothetical protein
MSGAVGNAGVVERVESWVGRASCPAVGLKLGRALLKAPRCVPSRSWHAADSADFHQLGRARGVTTRVSLALVALREPRQPVSIRMGLMLKLFHLLLF